MKIYFAGAIRGGREDADLYFQLIDHLQHYGEVLTEHVGSPELSGKGETTQSDSDIYNRDLDWLQSADVMVAEVSTPSLGVGYELGIAEKLNFPILCLYRPAPGKRLSAMISGNEKFNCQSYQSFAEAKKHINNFLKKEQEE
ncbi:MAG: nucleoside 2-deoxyribosyltransferase [Candidatus Marinimicrobia bacterium]|nr:nucleoside 2-deoxyribosyltransferase [Candidatus Neomarinimicrobiota bacterium]